MLIILSARKDSSYKEFDNFVRIYWEYLIDFLRVLKYKKPLPQLRELQSAIYKKNNTFSGNERIYIFFVVSYTEILYFQHSLP